MPEVPTTEVVAVAWLRLCAGLSDATVATTLPKPAKDGSLSWGGEGGFLQVQALAGGSPHIDVPLRRPVLQLDGWGASSGQSNKPQWGAANNIIELARIATEEAQTGRYGRVIGLGPRFMDARVQAAYFVTEPTRVPGDPSGYARYTADMALDWVPA